MTDRLAELLLAWEDGDATATQLDELAALLEADEGSRDRAVAHFDLSAAIAEQLHEADYTQSVADELHAMSREDQSLRERRGGSRLAWAAAMAILAAVTAAAYYFEPPAWLSREGEQITAPLEQPTPVAEQPVLVARRGIVQMGIVQMGIVQMGEARRWAVLDVGHRAAAACVLETGSESYATLRYDDDTRLELSPDTRIKIEHGAGKRLTLLQGAFFASVAPQPAPTPMIVNSGRYDQVTVVGTEFELRRELSGEAIVRVATGRVKFGNDAQAVAVGQQQESRVAAEASKPSAPQAVSDDAIWHGWEHGLTGEYYRGESLLGESFTRIDPQIDFDWGDGTPDPSITGDFSVRWTGQVEPPHTGEFVFTTEGYYGVRLLVNNELLINSMASMGSRESTPPLRLDAGRRYPIRIDYFDRQRNARMRLLWSSDKMPQTVIDRRWLYPAAEKDLKSP